MRGLLAEQLATESAITNEAAANGQYFFHVKAKNGKLVGQSEIYVSESNAERGRDAFVALMASHSVAAPSN